MNIFILLLEHNTRKKNRFTALHTNGGLKFISSKILDFAHQITSFSAALLPYRHFQWEFCGVKSIYRLQQIRLICCDLPSLFFYHVRRHRVADAGIPGTGIAGCDEILTQAANRSSNLFGDKNHDQ